MYFEAKRKKKLTELIDKHTEESGLYSLKTNFFNDRVSLFFECDELETLGLAIAFAHRHQYRFEIDEVEFDEKGMAKEWDVFVYLTSHDIEKLDSDVPF